MTSNISEPMSIAVRAYATKATTNPVKQVKSRTKKITTSPSLWTLIFDTETTTDAAQNLRFGTYQVRQNGALEESGTFFNSDILSADEIQRLKAYTKCSGITCMPVQSFIDNVFYVVGYQYRATIVGFNLPFDISRLAIEHAPARSSKYNKIMRGGFTFKLSENTDFPRIQIKHISSRDAFIQFAAPRGQRTSRGNRKKKQFQPTMRGFFIDVKTLAAALTSQSHSLDSLSKRLNVDALKHSTEEHGQKLTDEYIAYAVQDTQTTWECYQALVVMYEQHGLKLTAPHNIHSEASLGKAYLKEMGITPWRQLQSDFPPELIGQIMSAYYGGRSEVHIRRKSVQVLYCDFLSMYPTVCTLMGLWQFVTAQGMNWQDSTEATCELLDTLTIEDLQDQGTWGGLTTLVQVTPDEDIFPARAKYGGDAQYTIGANYLTSEYPLWYTLADCIASKLLTGKAPKITKAIKFRANEPQEGLQSVCVAGNADYKVDPTQGDFFKRIIDLRQQVKNQMKSASDDEKSVLDSQQLSLKILANSTSYGIFVELNVEEEKLKQSLNCFGHRSEAIPLKMRKFEMPGLFFHPLLAALITGAARLKLAITERLALDTGLDWAFCDTDSMALARPDTMDQTDFYARAKEVQEWFKPLNPYDQPGSLLKIEDENYSLSNLGEIEPLYCYAISSKRYALYNLDAEGKPILRKASEHGLGHLLPPYKGSMSLASSGAKNWQHDLWLEIIQAAQEKRQPYLNQLQDFAQPAVSRYGATSPALLRWFNTYNADKSYSEQVKPFNFLLALQTRHDRKQLKPASPFVTDVSKAPAQCFDRNTGETIAEENLKTYQESLAQYHLHPETKFLNGDYLDTGKTERRHIVVHSIQYIGKEANKWEEQYILGYDPDSQIEYGTSEEGLETVIISIKQHGIKKVAGISRISVRHLHNIYHKKTTPSEKVVRRLVRTVSLLNWSLVT